MKTLVMMPGQGSQKKGMGQELVAKYSTAKAVFAKASDALGYDMEELCFLDPGEKLVQTEYTQPALLTVSLAMWEVAKENIQTKDLIFAGHSLGEISALVAAECLEFGEAVKLVRSRGREMQKACPVGKGAMAAILKLSPAEIQDICNDLSTPEKKVQPANYNSSGQTVISGESEKVAQACERVKEQGGKAIPLKAKSAMKHKIEGLSWKNLQGSFIPNVSAEVCKTYNSSFLVDQITSPVRWVQTLHCAVKEGVNEFIEVGPGNVLCGLAKRELKDMGPICLNASGMYS